MVPKITLRNLCILSTLSLLAACGGSGDGAAADTTASTGEAATAATDTPATATTTDAGTTAGSDTPTGTDTGSGTTGAATTGVPGDCGNDMIEDGEQCDGADLGGKQCADVDPAYIGGTLVCGASCTFDASGCMVAPDEALVVLNELTSDQVAAGPNMGIKDAIELHNAGGKAADLSGWMLSDDPMFAPAKTYVFPGGSTLAPGAYLVLVPLDPLTMLGDFPFGISGNTVETLTLADAQAGIVDSVDVDGYKALVSYCRIPDGVGAWDQCEQTFGAANQLAATACGNGKLEDLEECDGAALDGKDCAGLGLGFSGGTLGCTPKCHFDTAKCTTSSKLVINELESITDNIELFNGDLKVIDLSGWILTDDKIDANYDPQVDVAELVFAPGTSIAAGAYLVVPLGVGPGQHPFGLGMMGDRVTLAMPNLKIVDQVTYGAAEADISYCRKPNGPGGAWTVDCAPTMGGAN